MLRPAPAGSTSRRKLPCLPRPGSAPGRRGGAATSRSESRRRHLFESVACPPTDLPAGRCDCQCGEHLVVRRRWRRWRSTGLRGLGFLPNAVDWAAVRRGRRGSPAGIICRHPTSSTPSDRSGGAALPESDTSSKAAIASCLGIAARQGFRDIAFPAIATGIYAFPPVAAARIAIATVGAHLVQQQFPERVTFVCFDAPTLDAYRDALGVEV
jgi:Macro domain